MSIIYVDLFLYEPFYDSKQIIFTYNIYINPPSPVLFLFETAHTIATEIISFSVGTTSNIPANGEPKCLETTEGSGISGVCIGDIKVQSGLPVYSDPEFQNKVALAYETSSITDVDRNVPETISIDSSVLKFSSTNGKDEPNEIRFGGLVTNVSIASVLWII